MSYEVKVKKPVNIDYFELNSIFDPLDYSINSIFAKEIKEVKLTRSGGVFGKILPVMSSQYKYGMDTVKHVSIGYGSMLSNHRIKLGDSDVYCSGHNMWSGGYFHWVTESLLRLQAAIEAENKAVCIIPGNRTLTGIYKESAKCLGFSKILEIPKGYFVKVPRYLMVSNPEKKAEYEPKLLSRMRNRIMDNCGIRIKSPWRSVYVSRSRARGRFVENESDLITKLSQRGFELYHFEDMSFTDQVKLMTETKILISIHGAALANITFMNPGTSAIEIVPDPRKINSWAKIRKSWHASPTYCRLASVCGVNYNVSIGKPVCGKFDSLPNVVADIIDICNLAEK